MGLHERKWTRNPAGELLAAPVEVVQVFAQHDFGFCRHSGGLKPHTILTLDREGFRFVARIGGFLEHGAVVPSQAQGKSWRLTLIAPKPWLAQAVADLHAVERAKLPEAKQARAA